MIKVKDGYAKLIGVSALGAANQVLLSNGGNLTIGNAKDNIPLNNGTVNTNLNADTLDGWHISDIMQRYAGNSSAVDLNTLTSGSSIKVVYWAYAGSDNIPQLKSFDWKSDGKHSYGLIALELEEQGYNELVEDRGDHKTVNYSAALSLIVGKLLVKLQEIEKENKELRDEIDNLKNNKLWQS